MVWLGGRWMCSVMGGEDVLWEVACMSVGEVKCLALARTFFLKVWPQIHFPPNLQKDTKSCGKTKKREREKHVISRNSENHTFLRKDMQTKISTEQTPGNCYFGLDPG